MVRDRIIHKFTVLSKKTTKKEQLLFAESGKFHFLHRKYMANIHYCSVTNPYSLLLILLE